MRTSYGTLDCEPVCGHWTEDERLVASVLLDLKDLVPMDEFRTAWESGIKWEAKKERSVRISRKTGWLQRSDEDYELQVLKENEASETYRRDCLKDSLRKVKMYYEQLALENARLKVRKFELLSSGRYKNPIPRPEERDLTPPSGASGSADSSSLEAPADLPDENPSTSHFQPSSHNVISNNLGSSSCIPDLNDSVTYRDSPHAGDYLGSSSMDPTATQNFIPFRKLKCGKVILRQTN